jgi:hypothetical protein
MKTCTVNRDEKEILIKALIAYSVIAAIGIAITYYSTEIAILLN